jgi:hypothetical protein
MFQSKTDHINDIKKGSFQPKKGCGWTWGHCAKWMKYASQNDKYWVIPLTVGKGSEHHRDKNRKVGARD